MKKKAQVHLISTNKKAAVGSIVTNKQGQIAITNVLTIDDPNHSLYTTQHLHFTTDEEIKKGDWYIQFNPLEIRQDSNDAHGMCSCRKIVATTNPELWYKDRIVNDVAVSEYLSVAKISNSFIQSYIRCYNEGVKIEEVMIEHKYPTKVIAGMEVNDSMKEIIRIDSDGTCITSPVETKMYTREEVIILLENIIYSDVYRRNYVNDGDDDNPSWDDMGAEIDEDNFNSWIEANL